MQISCTYSRPDRDEFKEAVKHDSFEIAEMKTFWHTTLLDIINICKEQCNMYGAE